MLGYRRFGAFALATGLAAIGSAPALAHHGTAINYQMGTQIKMEVVVKSFRYANPHLQMFFDEKKPNGKVVNWACEYIPNIPFLIRSGWPKGRMTEMLRVGEKISVIYTPSRSGQPVCLILKMTNAKGEVIGPAFDK